MKKLAKIQVRLVLAHMLRMIQLIIFFPSIDRLLLETICTLVALESPVSSSGLSPLVEPDLINVFSEELKDDSRSMTELLLAGDSGIGLIAI